MNGQAVADAGGMALGEPGPVRVMAEMLAGRGFEVRGPVPEDERHLAVVGAARARCEIGIDNGRLSSYYFPAAGADTDPAELCGMVLRILGVDAGESAGQYAHLHRGATLKGAVALRLFCALHQTERPANGRIFLSLLPMRFSQ